MLIAMTCEVDFSFKNETASKLSLKFLKLPQQKHLKMSRRVCGSLNEFDLLNTQIAGLFTGSSPSVIELESHRHTTDNNRHNRKMNFTYFLCLTFCVWIELTHDKLSIFRYVKGTFDNGKYWILCHHTQTRATKKSWRKLKKGIVVFIRRHWCSHEVSSLRTLQISLDKIMQNNKPIE